MGITTLPLDHLLASRDAADLSGKVALHGVSLAIAKCRRAVVISGAGISCSSGIPDFRSSDGLYNLVKDRYPDAFVTGKDLFSSGLFTNPTTTSLFYSFIAELKLKCEEVDPTPTHHFIGKLHTKKKLLRSYTQNIDGLERRIGLESGGRGKGLKKMETKNVEMHGDLGRVRCVLCMADFEAKEEWMEIFREGLAPECPSCEDRCASRVSRSARAVSVGTLRPSIVLYDEPHPLGEEIGGLQAYDLYRNPDLLLIMGTSLKVHGLKKVVKQFAKAVHSKKGLVVFVNATPPSKEWEGIIDIHIHGQTDKWVQKAEEDWRKTRPQDWETQTTLAGDVIKPLPKVHKGKGPAKPKAPDAEEAEPFQLPTPRPSQSPRRNDSSSFSSPLSSPPSSPSSSGELPPTPFSPSKRRAAATPLSPVSVGTATPSKKRMIDLSAPRTGLISTPGRGNLFAAASESVTKETDDWEEVIVAKRPDVFGTPVPKNMATRKRVTAGKENQKPKPRATTTKAALTQLKPPRARSKKLEATSSQNSIVCLN